MGADSLPNPFSSNPKELWKCTSTQIVETQFHAAEKHKRAEPAISRSLPIQKRRK
jgi:hypothetical protein